MSASSSQAQQEHDKVKKFLEAIPASVDSTNTNVTFESKRDSNEVRWAFRWAFLASRSD
jgi:uncharacterized FlaG/YvyC family protein